MEVSFSYVVFTIVIIIMLSYYSYQQTVEKNRLQKQLDGDVDALATDKEKSDTIKQAFLSTDVKNNTSLSSEMNTDITADVNNTTFMSI